MELYLDRRAVKQIRLAAQEAIEEGDSESLREDVIEAFTEEQVEEIERRLDSADFFEFLTEVIDEWGGDDVDELFELLETQLGEVGIDLDRREGRRGRRGSRGARRGRRGSRRSRRRRRGRRVVGRGRSRRLSVTALRLG
jgi:hypothetical protein